MNILDVLNKEFKTVLTISHESDTGHWLVKDAAAYPLYSISKKMLGSEVLSQINTMQRMINDLQLAQKRLVELLES